MALQQIYNKIYEYKRTETNLTGPLLSIGLYVRAVGNVNRFICSGFSKMSKCDKEDTYQWRRWRCGISSAGV
jgi:hypothetical protein